MERHTIQSGGRDAREYDNGGERAFTDAQLQIMERTMRTKDWVDHTMKKAA